jgi:hypothetical protein
VCDIGVARPDLAAVDHVLVAVALGSGAQGRQVGTGIGLAEALTPSVLAADQPRQEALLDDLGSVTKDPLHEVTEMRSRWCAGVGQLLVEDDVVHAR